MHAHAGPTRSVCPVSLRPSAHPAADGNPWAHGAGRPHACIACMSAMEHLGQDLVSVVVAVINVNLCEYSSERPERSRNLMVFGSSRRPPSALVVSEFCLDTLSGFLCDMCVFARIRSDVGVWDLGRRARLCRVHVPWPTVPACSSIHSMWLLQDARLLRLSAPFAPQQGQSACTLAR